MLSQMWGKCMFLIVPCSIAFLLGLACESENAPLWVGFFLFASMMAHYIWSVLDLQAMIEKNKRSES